MFTRRIDSGWPLAIIEWLAKLGSIASIVLLALIFFGEVFEPSRITRNEWIGLLFFPIGLTIGLVIAWWREGLGSVISVGSLAGFYVVWGYLFRNHIGGPWFIAFASPGFLFLLHWLLRSGGGSQKHAMG